MTRPVSSKRLVFVLAATLAAPAWAQQAPPRKIPPAQMSRAREHFKKGQAFHAAGKYGEAIAEYQAAYQDAPLPDLLFNLAQVQRLLGDKQAALDNYLAYLEQAPTGRGADESRTWASALSKELRDVEAARRQHDEEEAARLRAEREADRAADDKRHADDVASRPVADVAPAAHDGKSLRIAGITTGAVGVVALGLGTYFALHAKSLSDEQNGLTEWNPGLVSDGNAASRNAIIAFSVAGAAVVAGGVLYALGLRADRASSAAPSGAEGKISVAPVVGGGSSGLVVVGRF